MTDVRIAISTVASAQEARQIAQTLVEERLAACVNIVSGVESVYRWDDKVETAGECLLLIKTIAERMDALRVRLHELHSYRLPEFMVLDAVDGSKAYLEWVKANASSSLGPE